MADSTISQLPPALTVNTTDVVPIDQAGVTKRATLQQVGSILGAFPPSLNYPMGGHKFTGLGLGSAAGDSVPYEQVGPLSRADEPKYAGFLNNADFSIGWNNTTRTLTVTPTGTQFQFYANGILYTKTTIETITIPNTTGNYYFYYDTNGILSVATSFNNNFILIYSFLASLYWNATTSLAVPDATYERHQAAMPAQTHLYLHSTVGTAYDSYVGGLLPSVTADGDGSLDAHIEFSATPGAIWDDDVQEIISVKQLLDNIPIMYRTGAAGVWTFDETSPTMVRTTGTGRAAYNQFTGGAWQLTEVTDTQFMLMHLYAFPGFSKKWMMIMGQAEYATLTLASNAALTEITAIAAIPLSENKAIASFVIQTNAAYTNSVKSRVRVLDSGADFIDWRFAQVGGAGASGTGGNVVGPVGATADNIAVFNGATGTVIKDGGTVGTMTHAAANKTTPVDADEFPLSDSAASFALKNTTWANIKATLKTYFDTLYAYLGVIAGKAIQVDQSVTAWTRAATTTLGTSLNGTLSDTSVTVTAFNGVAGVTYHVRALGAGSITNSVSLIITQGGVDIATAAGDTFDVEMITATTCRIKNYTVARYPIFTTLTNSLGADVSLNNIANYFDGPTVAQGTQGTWLVTGQVTVRDSVTASFFIKLWDGTTVINSAYVTGAANTGCSISLSGVMANPAGNLRISVRDSSNTSGTIFFNVSGNSKDSTITAVRIG